MTAFSGALCLCVLAAATAQRPASRPPPGEATRTTAAPVARTAWRPGQGLTLRSADGRFALRFGAYTQIQARVRHRGPIAASGTMSTDDPKYYRPAQEAIQDLHVSLRRARLIVSGNLFTPHIKYRLEITGAPVELGYKDGAIRRLPLLDLYLTLDRARDATVQVGQYKVPYNHQRMLRASGLQFVDRAAASDEFTLDRDLGLDLRSADIAGLGKFRYYAGIYIGDGAARVPADTGLAYVGRIELLPFGLYDDLEESDHDRTRPRLLLGGAFAYIDRDPHDTHGLDGKVPTDLRRTSTANATADMSFRWAGFAFEGAFFWRKAVAQTPGFTPYGPLGPVGKVEARNGHGWFAQAGYLLPRLPLELGARWGGIHATGDPSAAKRSLRDQHELGGALNYYFARHALKLQMDYLRIWRAQIHEGTDHVRLQLQVMF